LLCGCAPATAQLDIFSGPIGPSAPESEDCLTLNVFVPRRHGNHQRKLPVFIWSYGGGFSEGSGSAPLYNPTDFVAENKDIIVVTWKYDFSLSIAFLRQRV
jgi:para-nitrobenzyl esterase